MNPAIKLAIEYAYAIAGLALLLTLPFLIIQTTEYLGERTKRMKERK